jgi:hypothetical protein
MKCPMHPRHPLHVSLQSMYMHMYVIYTHASMHCYFPAHIIHLVCSVCVPAHFQTNDLLVHVIYDGTLIKVTLSARIWSSCLFSTVLH